MSKRRKLAGAPSSATGDATLKPNPSFQICTHLQNGEKMQTDTAFKDLTLDCLARVLDDAATDFQRRDDESLYILDEPFPYFLRLNDGNDILIFWTHLNIIEGIGADELRDFANDCNCNLNLVQFSYHNERQRFYGHYALVVKDGLNRKQVLRTGRRFAGTFHEAAKEGIERGLLRRLEDCCEERGEQAQSHDCTVH